MNLESIKNIELQPIEIDFNGEQIKVIPYLDEIKKMYIANRIAKIYFGESILSDDTGESDVSVDFFSNKNLKHCLIVNNIINFYTDLDFDSEDILEVCDAAIKSGLYENILEAISFNEINTLLEMIDEAIENKYKEIQEEKSIESTISNFIEWIKEKIPSEEQMKNFIQEIPKMLEGLDKDKLEYVNKLYNVLK